MSSTDHQGSDQRWGEIINDERPRSKLEAFVEKGEPKAVNRWTSTNCDSNYE